PRVAPGEFGVGRVLADSLQEEPGPARHHHEVPDLVGQASRLHPRPRHRVGEARPAAAQADRGVHGRHDRATVRPEKPLQRETTLDLLLVVENLTRGLAELSPSESVTLEDSPGIRLPELTEGLRARLEAREFVLWI